MEIKNAFVDYLAIIHNENTVSETHNKRQSRQCHKKKLIKTIFTK